MWFEIPEEHRDTPEAREMLRIASEFDKVCAEEADAVKRKLWQSDPDAFEAVGARSRELQQQLKEAVAAFDRATGEPKPLPLLDEVIAAVQTHFSEDKRVEVVEQLGKTLAYLKRQRVDDPRVPHYILRLCEGDIERLRSVAAEVRVDYRDIIVAAEGLSGKTSP